MPSEEQYYKGKTVSLCIYPKKYLQGPIILVVMDSGFCVLQALVGLRHFGVFISLIIKKKLYLPSYIEGGNIKDFFNGKEPR